MSHYKAFIDTAQCLKFLSTQLQDVTTNLDALLEGVPALQSAAASFTQQAQAVLHKRSATRQLYSKSWHPDWPTDSASERLQRASKQSILR